MVSAALVAVTTQVNAPVVVRVAPEIEQPVVDVV